jgi:hypothetical protein
MKKRLGRTIYCSVEGARLLRNLFLLGLRSVKLHYWKTHLGG